MAAVWRALARQGRSLNQLYALRQRLLIQPACFISTSKKNKDVAVPVQPMPKSEELKKLEEHFADTSPDADKNWVSYGYEPTDPEFDNFVHHVTMFITVTLCICWGAFILAYQPDHKSLNWCSREAYLEMERRQREGLPLVSPDYVDPSKIELPSDEELGDTEIIV
eukprot:TRINITY_DN50379_c0_g2_i1.p1 TRINITY_DN50379_c0_g2~~TRINITY_DN50379_c0_g2_i1.p1  ORF type:complete len:181 (+),score=30.81 TRINITY_DN50379_c0_g2_i1:46-543(+)